MLIGSDYYWSIVGDETIRGAGPTSVYSKLGYLVSGSLACTGPKVVNQALSLTVSVVEETSLSRFWDLELLGIESNATLSQAATDYH